ncbi:unnamed protein product [Nezara viridula]|uniref:Uncharacterized protein n=1 Tax=Nezara viridula TaxID=85310 RepID=A0A9P0H394_NEZVI|nr:unnamed protein product [Nezara viridula]
MDDFLYTRKLSEEDIITSLGLQERSPRLRSVRTLSERLRIALSRSMLDNFWALIKAGADINGRDRLSRTPLHLVIYWRKELTIVKAVLSAGADPNAIDHHGFTPIHAAVHSNSSAAIFKALISAGADIDTVDCQGKTPLIKSIYRQDNISIVRTLLGAGANVNAPNLMVEAVKAKADQEILRLFLMAGASVNATYCGLTAIYFAVLNGDPIIVKMLLVAEASVDFLHPETRRTLLHEVTVGEIARELIKRGVSVNAMDNHGETPLHKAVAGDHIEVVMTLIKAGANVHAIESSKGNNCLHMVRSAAVIKALVTRGVDINARNRRGETPLQTLITNCSLLLSPLMRVRGLHVRYFKDTNSMQMNESIYAVKEMLNQGAIVNTFDYYDKTILESAVTHGHSKMVAYMINHGVEVDWRKLFRLNVINQTALQLLVRESMIGNVVVKGKKLFNHSPSEEPFLNSVKHLLSYTKRCVAEIELMKAKRINCYNTIYHFVVEISPEIKALRLCSHYEVSAEEYLAMFPIYRNHVGRRLNLCYKRGMMLDILELANMSAPRIQGPGMVSLINDCKFAIAKFLSNDDLFNWLVGMGFNVTDKGYVKPNH